MSGRLGRAARSLALLVLAVPGVVPGAVLAARSLVAAPAATRAPAAAAARTTSSPTVAALVVHRYDARLDALLAPELQAEVVADGHVWLEGPVWDAHARALFYSDIPRNAVYRWTTAGGARLFLQPSGYSGTAPFGGREPGSNGLALDAEGRLVLCQHGDRRIARREPDGSLTGLAERYQGKRFNSPNDLVYRSDGALYFTDPHFGLPGGLAQRELDWNGVYRLGPDGTVSLLTSAVAAPNGLAFSPDERVLYVSNAAPERAVWYAFEVRGDGALAQPRVLADVTSRVSAGPGLPDGLKLDTHGHLFATGPGGIYVMTPEGRLLGWLETGVATANLAWGEDGSVLYVTASTRVLRLPTRTRGRLRPAAEQGH